MDNYYFVVHIQMYPQPAYITFMNQENLYYQMDIFTLVPISTLNWKHPKSNAFSSPTNLLILPYCLTELLKYSNGSWNLKSKGHPGLLFTS